LEIRDLEILDAVRYHTTSRAGANSLERLVFVADKIALDPSAPVREFVPAVRSAAQESLEWAAFVYLDWGLIHGAQLGWVLHPNTSAAYTELREAGFGKPADAGG
jgi:HD superfamily phosphohydrolase YqeK